MCNRSQAGRECKQPELEGPSLKENTYCSPVIWSTLKWSSERGGSWTILYLFCMYIVPFLLFLSFVWLNLLLFPVLTLSCKAHLTQSERCYMNTILIIIFVAAVCGM